MYPINDLLKGALDASASDIFIIAGYPLACKINNLITPQREEKLWPADTNEIISEIYAMVNRDITKLNELGDDDFSFSIPKLGRFRCNAYKQRNSLAAVIRVVYFDLPNAAELGILPNVTGLSKLRKGLVLVTGSAGSGKSTTLACIVDEINRTRHAHIITIEDPIEFIHHHNQSIVSQREIEHDTGGYDQALRAALRQAPDVIFLGEMRDFETIHTAITAAETGQLVLSTLHTIGAAKTIDRVIDVFPAGQQQQIRVQLSMALQAVVSQQLIPCLQGGMVPAFEVMTINSAIRNLIKDAKIYQIDNAILAGASEGMVTMDASILKLYQQGQISRDSALMYSTDPNMMKNRL